MSGRKNFLAPYLIINAGDMSAASVTSSVTNIERLDNICLQFISTGAGSPNGTIAIQGSLDGTNWAALPGITAPTVTGSDINVLSNLNQRPEKQIRVTYTKSSGTGTLNVYLCAKML
jgi:hypothetical protein